MKAVRQTRYEVWPYVHDFPDVFAAGYEYFRGERAKRKGGLVRPGDEMCSATHPDGHAHIWLWTDWRTATPGAFNLSDDFIYRRRKT